MLFMEQVGNFVEIASEIGIMYRCSCGAVVDQDERETHVCPQSKEDEKFVQYKNDLQGYIDKIGDVSLPVKERVSAIKRFGDVQKEFLDENINRLEKVLTQKVLHGLILKEMSRRLDCVRKVRDSEYQKNDDLRMKGVSFIERKALINKKKIEWCDTQEEYLIKISQSFQVKPIREWMDESVYWSGKRAGVQFIIRVYFEEIIKTYV